MVKLRNCLPLRKGRKLEPENKARGNWGGKLEFILSCTGYAVGLGNIWRFPYLCYKNGGGAFLIPYLTCLLLIGCPLFFFETAFGQFCSLGPLSAWRISPFFKGIGAAMVVLSSLVNIYYNIILCWGLYYLYHSFSYQLPWSNCDNEWNTPACVVRSRGNITTLGNATFEYINGTENVTGLTTNVTELTTNITELTTNVTKFTSPSEEFWLRHVLQITPGIEDMGGIRWQLMICFVLSWICVFLCVIKGIKSAGKVVYVTATFPYLLLTVLLIRGATLPGAIDGVLFYIVPRWKEVARFEIWVEAAMQIVYSNGATWGGIVVLASYNKFHNNCYREAVVASVVGAFSSIFSGFAIFTILGYVAYETGLAVKDVATQGPGLLFVVYPAGLARLPVSQLWSVLFFLLIYCVGLDSLFAMIELPVSTLADEFPKIVRPRKVLVTAVYCFVTFLLGIPCLMQGGMYVLQLMDWYTATFSALLIGFGESIVICWVYGVNQFFKDIELMLGFRPCVLWKVVWAVITPALTLGIFIFSAINHSAVTYGDYHYPAWAIGIGWMISMTSLVPFPIFMFCSVKNAKGSLRERIKEVLQPAPEWGPALTEHRRLYIDTLTGSRKSRILRNISDSHDEASNGMIHPATEMEKV